MSRLILWDVMLQHDFVSSQGKCPVPEAAKAAAVCVALMSAARAADIPRIAVLARRRLEDPDIALRGWNHETTFPPHCLLGTPGAEPIAGAEPVEGDRIVAPRSFDPFLSPAADSALEALGPATIVVCGLPLEHSVRTSVEGLLARGRSVRVVEDGVAALKPAAADGLIASWTARGVEVLPAALALRPPGPAAGP